MNANVLYAVASYVPAGTGPDDMPEDLIAPFSPAELGDTGHLGFLWAVAPDALFNVVDGWVVVYCPTGWDDDSSYGCDWPCLNVWKLGADERVWRKTYEYDAREVASLVDLPALDLARLEADTPVFDSSSPTWFKPESYPYAASLGWFPVVD